MRWNRHGVNPQQTHPLRIADTNRFSVGQLDFRKAHAFAQNAAFLFGRPLRCKWKKFFQLIDGRLSIHVHVFYESRNLAES